MSKGVGRDLRTVGGGEIRYTGWKYAPAPVCHVLRLPPPSKKKKKVVVIPITLMPHFYLPAKELLPEGIWHLRTARTEFPEAWPLRTNLWPQLYILPHPPPRHCLTGTIFSCFYVLFVVGLDKARAVPSILSLAQLLVPYWKSDLSFWFLSDFEMSNKPSSHLADWHQTTNGIWNISINELYQLFYLFKFSK